MLTQALLTLALAINAPPAPSKFEKLARDIETQVQAGKDGITAAWDSDGFLAKVMAGSGDDINNDFKKGFAKGYKSKEGSLGQTIASTVTQGGRFRLMRIHEEGGQTRLLYRLLMPTGGLSYFDLVTTPAGKVVDAYIFTSGELLSETIRRLYLQTAAEASQGLFDKLKGKEQLFLKNLPTLTAMQNANNDKQPAKALELYKGLPEPLRRDRLFLVARLQAAQAVSDDEYLKAIDELRAAFGNDPASDLMAIDGFFLKKKYDLAIEAINRLNTAVGGDAYLVFMRGSMLSATGKGADAKTTFIEASKMEPSLTEPYWALVEMSLNDKKFNETTQWLLAIERETNTRLKDLKNEPTYAAFVKSPHYKKWLAVRPKLSNQ
ncbi:MAG: hypothetical protein K1X64_02775 [Myxococcaceae bacterium]|nr:hypothetical protein [Myxococcaceae bacterium]